MAVSPSQQKNPQITPISADYVVKNLRKSAESADKLFLFVYFLNLLLSHKTAVYPPTNPHSKRPFPPHQSHTANGRSSTATKNPQITPISADYAVKNLRKSAKSADKLFSSVYFLNLLLSFQMAVPPQSTRTAKRPFSHHQLAQLTAVSPPQQPAQQTAVPPPQQKIRRLRRLAQIMS